MGKEKERKLTVRDELTDFFLYTAPAGQVEGNSVISILETTAADGKNYIFKQLKLKIEA